MPGRPSRRVRPTEHGGPAVLPFGLLAVINPADTKGSTMSDSLDALRAELVSIRDRAAQISKTVSPDDYHYQGPAGTIGSIPVIGGHALRTLTEAEIEIVKATEEVGHRYHRDAMAAERAVWAELQSLAGDLAPLADRTVAELGGNCFPKQKLPPEQLPDRLRPSRLDMDLFGLQSPDVLLAGRLFIVWSAWASQTSTARPLSYREHEYLPWLSNLVQRRHSDPCTIGILGQPFDWAILAFDDVANWQRKNKRPYTAERQANEVANIAFGEPPPTAYEVPLPGIDEPPPEAGPYNHTGHVDLKGERFARLHRRFMDASARFSYLHYIAATGHNNCPGWPNVPDSSGYNYLGLRHKDWLDVMNKPPGTLFAPIGGAQWLQIDGQLWHGAFFFDGPLANLTDADHESLHRQYAELRGAVDLFELLAHEAAGFLGPIPWKHALVEFPRKPELSHRWLEAVCDLAPVEPAGYHCFDVRRVPGNIFQASAILLERLQAAVGPYLQKRFGTEAAKEPSQARPDEQPPPKQEPEPPFVPLPAHKAILDALDGRALRTDALANAAKLERRSLFNRKRTDGTVIIGYLTELADRKLVSNHPRLGYFRPDRPPPALKDGGETVTH